MRDNLYKATLIENGTMQEFRNYKSNEFKLGHLYSDRFNQMSFTMYLRDMKPDYYICNCMLEARRKKKERVKRKIGSIVIDGNALFLTLTFTDKCFEATSKETRRRYVARFLKNYCNEYAANIDYGKDNGREHYHAVVSCNIDIDFTEWHKYGAIKMRHIRSKQEQVDIVARYITKLTAHALKNTTGSERLIYSRNVIL